MPTSIPGRVSGLLLPALLLAAACTGEAPPTFADVQALGVPNARQPTPLLVTAGQLSPDQLAGLVDAGYTRFVSLRPASENGAGWEEGHPSLGEASFARLPVAGADGLTRQAVEALDRILDEAGNRPTVVYCGSANRVGAMLALRANWLDGAPADQALALGRAAGLTGLEPAVVSLLEEGGP